jgi:hypothetical protein
MRRLFTIFIPFIFSGLLASSIAIIYTDNKTQSPGIDRALFQLSKKCNNDNLIACEQLIIVKKARSGDFVSAINELKTKSLDDLRFQAECHQGAHIIGKLAYHWSGIKKVIETMPGICRAGIIHGAQEEWSEQENINIIIDQSRTLCSNLENSEQVNLTCIHGIGHSFQYSLGDLHKAGKLCEANFVPKVALECISGSVMSYTDLEQERGNLSDSESLARALAKCGLFSITGEQGCAQAFGVAILRGLAYESNTALEVCNTQKSHMAENCAIGVGNEAAYRWAGNLDDIIYNCTSSDLRIFDSCVAGAAYWTASNLYNKKLAILLCSSIPDGHRSRCDEILNKIAINGSSLKNWEDAPSINLFNVS